MYSGPIEIQCCQVQNIHKHKSRKDTDITKKFGESKALNSKRDECNNILTKPAEVRRK